MSAWCNCVFNQWMCYVCGLQYKDICLTCSALLHVLVINTDSKHKYWAYGKAGNGNEKETGNGNWKWKWEQKYTNHWLMYSTYQWLHTWLQSGSGSHMRGSEHKTSYNLTMRVTYFALLWNKASNPTLAASFLDQLPVLIACSVWGKLRLHTQALGTIAPFPTHCPPNTC